MDNTSLGLDGKLDEAALNEIRRGVDIVNPMISKLTSSKLKNVLKAITFVSAYEAAATGQPAPKLTKEEQELIDNIFALQEAALAHMINLNNKGEENGKKNEV